MKKKPIYSYKTDKKCGVGRIRVNLIFFYFDEINFIVKNACKYE